MKSHKFFVKEIKGPDEFITLTGRIVNFVKKEQKKLSWVIVAITALGAFAIFWPRYKASKAEEAAVSFYYTTKLFDAEIVEKKEGETPVEGAIKNPETFSTEKEKYETILSRLQKIRADFQGTPSAYYAHLFSGHAYYYLGEYDKAIVTYRAFLADTDANTEFQTLVTHALGMSFEKKESYPEAIEFYKKIVGEKGDFLKDLANYRIARSYEKSNNLEEATKYYSLVKDKFSDSSLNEDAKKHILMLPMAISHEK